MVDLDTIALHVEAAVYARDGKLHTGGRIRFRCPNPHHADEHPSADYSIALRTWICRSCGASGGLVCGDLPLATAMGVTTDESWKSPAHFAKLAAERAATMAAIAVDKARKAEALKAYWAAHQSLVTNQARAAVLDELVRQGITQLAVEHFDLHAGDFFGIPALVIPWTVRGEIRALQYRLADGYIEGRYRWHEGSRATLFNADAVIAPQDDLIVVVEGAKKTAALWSHGVISVCGIRNNHGWKAEWAPRFQKFDRVLFALDPDAWKEAYEAARTVPNGRVVRLPMKPDDLLVATGGDIDLLESYLDQAERAA